MRPVWRAAGVAVSYVLLAALYIVVSSALARAFAADVEQLERFERVKGVAFVLLTGVGLFALLSVSYARLLAQTAAVTEAREALLLAERRALPGLFVGSLAHDANNVSTVVLSALEEVRAEWPDAPPEAKHALDVAQRSMDKLVALFRDLTQFGKSGSSGPKVETELGELVRRDVALLTGHSAMKHCRVRVDAPPSLTIPVFPVLMDQLLVNLLLNAADATKGTGTVEVRVREEKDAVAVEVHDNGCGVPPERQAQLFRPFATTKAKGTGLGLVSVRQCALAHGGSVRYSTSPLGGACFTLTLPRSTGGQTV